jgi:hypothetical protein
MSHKVTSRKKRKRQYESESHSSDSSEDDEVPITEKSATVKHIREMIELRDKGKLQTIGPDEDYLQDVPELDEGERKKGHWSLDEDMDLYEGCIAFMEAHGHDPETDFGKLVHQKLGGRCWNWIGAYRAVLFGVFLGKSNCRYAANYIGGRRSAFQVRDRVILAYVVVCSDCHCNSMRLSSEFMCALAGFTKTGNSTAGPSKRKNK